MPISDEQLRKYQQMVGKQVSRSYPCRLLLGGSKELLGRLTISSGPPLPALTLLAPDNDNRTLWIMPVTPSFAAFRSNATTIMFTTTTAPFESCQFVFSNDAYTAEVMLILGQLHVNAVQSRSQPTRPSIESIRHTQRAASMSGPTPPPPPIRRGLPPTPTLALPDIPPLPPRRATSLAAADRPNRALPTAPQAEPARLYAEIPFQAPESGSKIVWAEPQTTTNVKFRQSTAVNRSHSMAMEKAIIADVLRGQAHKSTVPQLPESFHQMSLDGPLTLTNKNNPIVNKNNNNNQQTKEISKDSGSESGYSSLPSASATTVTAVSPSVSMTSQSDVDVFFSSDLTIIRHIERGGQASVQLASTKFHRKLAVKYFDRNQDKSGEYGRRELVNILRMTAHPHIVHFRGVLYDNPQSKMRNELPLGYLMEYMTDGSLHSVVHSRPRTQYGLTEVLNWTRQASSALCYLHSKSILHRDVKPANMLLCHQMKRLKLCDFGLSAGLDVNKTADVGTILYMAPEVMSSSTSRAVRYDANCDVYSLAISLWEILHRRTPFADEDRSLFALVSDVRGVAALRPTIDDSVCPRDMKTLIETSWAPNPASRTTMDEIHSFVVEKLEKQGFFEDYE